MRILICKLNAFLTDIKLNLTIGTISHITHRITGIAFLIFIFLHVLTLGSVFIGAEAFENALLAYDNPFGHVLEFSLMLAVSIHLVNGIRIIVIDFFNLSGIHKKLFWISFAIVSVIAILSIAVFFTVF